MIFNPQLDEILKTKIANAKKAGITIEYQELKSYCMAVYLGMPTIELYFKHGIIKAENEAFYRIDLTVIDPEDGTVSLKYLFFVSGEKCDNNLFNLFIEGLTQCGMTVNGHCENLKDYAVLDSSEETKDAFWYFYYETYHKDIDLPRLIACTCEYYRVTTYCKALKKYFAEVADLQYKGFKVKKSDML